jgi:hypothetical protein
MKSICGRPIQNQMVTGNINVRLVPVSIVVIEFSLLNGNHL